MIGLDAAAVGLAEQHVPVIVVAAGQRNIGSHPLPRAVIETILAQLLPPDIQSAFDDLGAIRYELTVPELGGERFEILATNGVRLRAEIRRRSSDDALAVPGADSIWPAA
jgi:hypothetical protein